MIAQDRSLLLWSEAWSESWSDASWKNLLGILPYGEQYDDPCEPSFKEFWSDKLKNWYEKPLEFISEIGSMSF